MKENILKYIQLWEKRCYFDGIPNEVPARLSQLNKAPSYKEICSAILKNDTTLKTLGITSKKSKYYSDFKRVEIEQRKDGKPKQLRLKL
jgi:predicted phosphoadenosine phosphosulfate sulfurtransferase|tara:strand:- start:908 stop:1174 length:267 start_codon:yes stop_codon:yes gene_type:complete